METISNIASTATSTVSNLIYGNQDTATKTNETAGKEPVSGQTGKGTVDEPYDQGNSEVALDKNTSSTTSTGIESTKVTEPTGSIQKPEDLIKAYDNEARDATTSTTGTSSVATEMGVGAHTSNETSSAGKDTLWRGIDAYKNTSSAGPDAGTGVKPLETASSGPDAGTGVKPLETTSAGPDAGTGVKPLEPTSTSTGSTITGTEPTRLTSGESTTGGPKGDVDAEPKNYSIGDLTSGKETPPKPVGDDATSNTEPKSSESAISPPDLSTTSPGEKPDYSADTREPSPKSGGTWAYRVGNVLNKADGVAGLIGERAGHGGPSSAVDHSSQGIASEKHSSSISPSGDDDEKSGKMDKLKDKLKTKLHIGSKDH
ncbi:hypothetical protein N0V86_008893 [Didymella sp. IMI 355093]|nr:hypothetical protein N0V86_008893 [Didymella sp. IMI 355093]